MCVSTPTPRRRSCASVVKRMVGLSRYATMVWASIRLPSQQMLVVATSGSASCASVPKVSAAGWKSTASLGQGLKSAYGCQVAGRYGRLTRTPPPVTPPTKGSDCMEPRRLLLVDDHSLFRDGLARLFAYEDD